MISDMWETLSSNPLGRLSMRKYLRFATALLAACFLYTFAIAPTSYAADAKRIDSSSISYNNNTFKGPLKPSETPSLNLPANISDYYLFVEEPAGTNIVTRKAHVIYFAPGNDPGTASTAIYKTYTLSGNSSFSDPSNTQRIGVTGSSELSTGTSSCKVDNIGWLVCGVAGWLADGMDYIYKGISNFLIVQPISGGNNSLYRAWTVAKDFANIVFILGFLVVIYSQLTGGGFSSYSMKKILPRIVIAAVLVNVSYWICAAAVDISNILGRSLQEFFIDLRENIVGSEVNTTVGWKEMSTYILSGGTVGAVGLLAATGGSIASAAFLLVGVLITILFAGLIAIIVLAARQALIIILIIIAPLAFVAYLLPNTEKWFEKWRSVFLTMLLLFPIFSVIFGGSQLASAVIIQNAPDMSVMLLGMAVQVAPLIITPLLIRFSGGIIGKIAGMANDTSKGAVDGARNWAKGNQELRKQRALGTPTRRRNIARRSAQSMNRGRMNREGMTKKYQQDAENMFGESAKGLKLHEAQHWTEREKERVHKAAEDHLSKNIYADKSLLEREMKVRLAVDRAAGSAERIDAVQQELKNGNRDAFGQGSPSASLASIVQGNEEATRELAVTAMRKQNAETAQKSRLTEELLANQLTVEGKTLREYAGGVRGEAGAESVLASSIATFRKEYGERIGEKAELIKHFNLSSGQRQELALGNSDVSVERDGATYTFKVSDEFTREAVIDKQLKAGSFGDIEAIIKESGKQTLADGTVIKGKTADFATSISEAIVSNGLPNKAIYFGSKTIDDVAQGKIYGDASLDDAVVYHVTNGKIKDDALAGMSAPAIERLFKVGAHPHTVAGFLTATPQEQQTFRENAAALKKSAYHILRTDELNKLADQSAKEVLQRFAEE